MSTSSCVEINANPERRLPSVYAIRPVKPSFLPVQPCAEMTADVPAGSTARTSDTPAQQSKVRLTRLLARAPRIKHTHVDGAHGAGVVSVAFPSAGTKRRKNAYPKPARP